MEIYRTGPETNRLEHRAFTLDDAEEFYALNSHPDVMRYTGETPVPSVNAAKQAIADYTDFETFGIGRWACVLKETQAIIGFCGLKYLPDLDAVDVGYRFLPQYWGDGLATEACIATLQFGFSILGLHEIIGLVLPENTASIRVLEKAKMQSRGLISYDEMQVMRYAKRRQPAQNALR